MTVKYSFPNTGGTALLPRRRRDCGARSMFVVTRIRILGGTALGRGSRVSRHPRATVSALAGTGPDGATGDVLRNLLQPRSHRKIQAVGFDMDYTPAEYIRDI